MTANGITTKVQERSPYLWLILGFALMFFSNGRWIIPITAWLATVFLLRFLRTKRKKNALLIGYLTVAVVSLIQWKGMIPLPTFLLEALVASAIALIYFLPFLIDRIITHHYKGFISTLVLPLAWVTIEYTHMSLNEFGQWSTIAGSQARNLPLLQLVSVTGPWGISFLIIWFAAVVNWVWEQELQWSVVRRGISIYTGILLTVLVLGQARMTFFPPDSETVIIGSTTAIPDDGSSRNFLTMGTTSNEALINNSGDVLELQDMLFDKSQKLVNAGAKIVFWTEAVALVHFKHESALIERGQNFAKEENVMLLMSLYTIQSDERHENKNIMIDKSGIVQSTYNKTKVKAEPKLSPGDGIIPVLDTEYGKIASAICYDFSSSTFIQQVGRSGVDIVLNPSWDWPEISPYFTWFSALRAVENGFSMVRQTNDGLSVAVDYQGRVLASVDHYVSKDKVMLSNVPTKGVRTFYGRFGAVFAWLCMVAFVFMIGKVILQK